MDFIIFRKSLESGRQGLNTLGAMLIVSVFLSAILFTVVYIVGYDQSSFPLKESLRWIHLFFTIFISALSIIFGIPIIYKKLQKSQYFLTVIVSQNLFAWLPLMLGLFMIGKLPEVSERTMFLILLTLICTGIIIFGISLYRLFILIKKGDYRGDTLKDYTRTKWESFIEKRLNLIIFVSTALFLISMSIMNHLYLTDIKEFLAFLLGSVIFLTMQFILPEQIIMMYCKVRFTSFNFKKNGILYPIKKENEYYE